MAFVAAKCTQCGASIEVDDSKEAGICSHCGTAFITEKVINNYNITNNIVNNVTQNIETAVFKTGDDEDDYYQRVAAHAKTGNRYLIEKTAKEMQEKFPHKGITYLCKADSYISYDYHTNNRLDVAALKKEIEDYEQSERENRGDIFWYDGRDRVSGFRLDSAKEQLEQADKMMMPADKEKYAEYEADVRDKISTVEKYLNCIERSKAESVRRYEIRRKRKIKILAGIITAAVVAIAVTVVILVL